LIFEPEAYKLALESEGITRAITDASIASV
jgi:hypothetical protein